MTFELFNKVSRFWQRMSDERRGITTSEFWMTLGTVMTTVAGSLFGIMKPIPAGIITSIIVFGYCISRGLAKRKPNVNIDARGDNPYQQRAWRKKDKDVYDDDR